MPDWHARAACRGMDADLFFPEKGNAGVLAAAKAKTICAACPVREECVAFAMTQDDSLAGIWGATTPKQRRLHRRKAG